MTSLQTTEAERKRVEETRALACIYSWDKNPLADHVSIDGTLLKEVAKLHLRLLSDFRTLQEQLAQADAVIKYAIQLRERMEATGCVWRDFSVDVFDEQLERHQSRQHPATQENGE